MANTKTDKIWADAIRKQVHEYHDAKDENGKVKKIRYLRVLASQLVTAAIEGDMAAMKEIGDRLDGKPHQSVTSTVKVEDELSDAELDQRIRALFTAIRDEGGIGGIAGVEAEADITEPTGKVPSVH